MKNIWVCHYAEIGLKGKNRKFFEKKLVSNIKKKFSEAEIYAPRGRIVLLTSKKDAREKLSKIPGIAYFFQGIKVLSKKEEIKKEVLRLAKEKDFQTFRVTVKRADKSFPLNSQEFASFLGREIERATERRVDLSFPEKNFIIEINSKEAYIYFQKIKGVGGLPVGTGGRAVSLLSGGIDSPVASFRMIKRGVENIFLHFHAYPATSKQSIEKVERIVKILSLYQGRSVFYLFPFKKIQEEIMMNTRESFRVLLYRRFMVEIAERIAEKERAKAVITGESLGQVASQTIENISLIEDAVKISFFRPLIGHSKEEIIKEAELLETYRISILPEEDCCVRFLPRNPQTKGKIMEVKKEEKKIKKEELIKEALKIAERKIIE